MKLLSIALLLCVLLSTQAVTTSRASSAAPLATFDHKTFDQPTPPTDAMCRVLVGRACYSPQELYRAYNINKLLDEGFTGKGQTIVIIIADGSPTIKHDLHTFDKGFDLPDPPSFRIFEPLGPIVFNPADPIMAGWAQETTLDVEWAHALAPDANIDLLIGPDGDPYTPQQISIFLKLEQYALEHRLGSIISQSWGTTENTFFIEGQTALLDQFNQFYIKAARQHVTVLAASGDTGSTGLTPIPDTVYPFRSVMFPASSPWVTTVGGTTLLATTKGKYQKEYVWNDPNVPPGASGGGVSQYFAEPDYQRSLPSTDQSLLHNYRGIPDVAYDADFESGILIYKTSPGSKPGYSIFGGTSAASPQWAGIIADANQMAGHPLGFLNDALYRISESDRYSRIFHDITIGNNSYLGVPGYNATPGWDATTGWGTPNVGKLVPELIHAIEPPDDDDKG